MILYISYIYKINQNISYILISRKVKETGIKQLYIYIYIYIYKEDDGNTSCIHQSRKVKKTDIQHVYRVVSLGLILMDCLFVFYGILTFVSYLMPNLFFTQIIPSISNN